MAETEMDFANWRVAEEAMTTGKLDYPPVKFVAPEVIKIPAMQTVTKTPRFIKDEIFPKTSTWVDPNPFPKTKAWVAPESPSIVEAVTPVTTFDFGHVVAGLLSSVASVSSVMSYLPGMLGALAGGFGIMKLVSGIVNMTSQIPTHEERIRQAATWIYFSVPWIKSAPFVKFLEDQKVVIDNVHQVGDRCYIAVAAYHTGRFKKEAENYKIEYKQVS